MLTGLLESSKRQLREIDEASARLAEGAYGFCSSCGEPVDVVTGFFGEDGKTRGRPVGVTVDPRGALLVADDVGNRVWRVSAAAPARSAA